MPRPSRPTHVYWQRGIPVATVAINNGTNAGLLAVRILGAGIPHLGREMGNYMTEMEKEVLGQVEKLELVGWESYQTHLVVQSRSRDHGHSFDTRR